ncbi:MAG TPA: aminoglycoside phosphotransferase family protein [Candidatus Nanopelagicales bacterium]|nr:aminoglycoside phosphotransferase family protein [Candidatus Nanopelagicales bacterium]
MREPVPTSRLLECAAIDDQVRDWLDVMPAAVRGYAEKWDLHLGAPYEPGGNTAWVAPAVTPDGEQVVLKVGMRHPEADREAAALRTWSGEGAVRLIEDDYDERSMALLLERCEPGTALAALPEPEQDTVIAAVLRRIWATPWDEAHRFDPLSVLCRTWADETEERLASGGYPGDPGLVRTAIGLLRECPARADDVLLGTDVHAENVLAASREPWLLVDPKPFVGDAAYDVVQHLLNCRGRLVEDPIALTGRLSRLTGTPVGAVRRWTFARAACELAWWPELAPVVAALASYAD